MAPKANKNKTPQEKALASKRVEFVKANPNLDPAEARQRFFVQTRAAELTSKGVEVTKEKRAQLRQKFQSGDVQRQGFYTPADIARIAARNTGGNDNDPPQDIIKPPRSSGANRAAGARSMPGVRVIQTPQSLSETKETSGLTGANKWIYENIAQPEMAAIARFNERNVKQFGSGTPLILRTAGGLGRGAIGEVGKIGESFNATFINPSVNLVGKLFGRNPNLRQAGPVEAAINTVDAIATVATMGGSKPLTALGRAGLEFAAEKLSTRGLARTSIAVDRFAARTGLGASETLVSAINATPPPGKSYVGPKAPGGPSKSGPILFEKNQKSMYADIASGKGPNYTGGPKSTYKPTDVLSTTKVKPVKTPKTKGSTTVKPKDAPEFLKGGLDNAPVFKNAPGTKIPKRVKPKGLETKGGPVVSTKASKNAAAQARADKLIEGGLSRVAPKSSTPNMNASSLSSMESTAPVTVTRATKGPKVSPAKAKAGAGVKTKMEQAKAMSTRSTVTPKAGVASFKNQAEYDSWMSTGGKFHLQNMTPEARQKFITTNEKFIAARGARKTAVTTTESKVVTRNVKFKGRYDRAAKRGSQMYPLANKLIAARRAAK
jgi:hypothetical protein